MKKKIIITILALLTFISVLAACSKTSSTASSTALSEVENLMVGIIKLDGTAQVITSDQVAILLPLWQAYQALMNSTTSSQTEKDALIKQISSSLTSDQLKAIDALNLTESDVQTLFANTGFNPTYEGTRVASTPSSALQSAASGASSGGPGGGVGAPGGGVMISGGDAAGGAGAPSGVMIFSGDAGGGADASGIPSTGINATPDSSEIATAQARKSDLSSNPMIYNLIIRYLQGKISAN
jgi:hypothetical protein